MSLCIKKLQDNYIFFYVPTLADWKADKFLGVEWNIRVRHQVFNDFFVFSDFAVFVPGGYYNDIKGTKLGSDVFSKLDSVDQSGVDSANYRLGNDTAFFFNLGVTYKF